MKYEYCEFCKPDFKWGGSCKELNPFSKRSGLSAEIYMSGCSENVSIDIEYNSRENSANISIDINFCPFCGRKFKTEVEI